jgi:hypothetical protein
MDTDQTASPKPKAVDTAAPPTPVSRQLRRFKYKNASAGRRALQWFAVVAVGLALIVLVGARSVFWSQSKLRDMTIHRHSAELNDYIGDLARTNRQLPPALTLDQNVFVEVRIRPPSELPVGRNEALGVPEIAEKLSFETRLRWDNILVLSVVAIVASVLAWTLLRGTGQAFAAHEFRKLPPPQSERTFIYDIFLADIENAQAQSARLNRRANVMLLAGLIVAMVGAAVLFAMLPEASSESGLGTALAGSIRPLGITIFVEAIAWYLLRQHRVLLEESRIFYQVYLRRSSQLGALALATDIGPNGASAILDALLKETSSDRLTSGETTIPLAASGAENHLALGSLIGMLLEKSTTGKKDNS